MPDALLFRRAVLAQLEAASPASLPVETVSEGLRLAGFEFSERELSAALEYLGKLTSDAVSAKAAGVKSAALASKCKLIATLADSLDKANASLEAALKKDDSKARIEAMNGVREIADKLELEVADDLWPMPKYSELLFVY